MKQFSRAYPEMTTLPPRPAPERHSREAPGRSAGGARARQRHAPQYPFRAATQPAELANRRQPAPGTGRAQPVATLRAPFEQGFGHDFSQVRIFPAGETAEAVHKAGSRAITCGPRIALAPGQWAPETPDRPCTARP
jgi:hypothetical protein